MSDFQYNSSSQHKDSAGQMEYLSEGIAYKIPCTTKFTENSFQLLLPDSFIMGNNDFLEKDTQSSFDSDDNDSQLSFEDRLELNHQKIMSLTLYKYFSLNFFTNQNILLDERICLKSQETVKEIQEKTIQEIKQKYGTEEAQKLKLMVNFLKRNQETTKIYYEVITRFSPQYRVSCYFLLNETLMTYLKTRQELKKEWRNYDQNEIYEYFRQNLSKITKKFKEDEKLAMFKFNTEDNFMNKKFQEFILTWMTTFYLSKEGLPSYQIQKASSYRQWTAQACRQADPLKKVKK